MDRASQLQNSLFKENQELKRKLQKANKRCNYLIRKIRSLKKQLEVIVGRKKHTNAAKQADEKIRDIQYPHR